MDSTKTPPPTVAQMLAMATMAYQLSTLLCVRGKSMPAASLESTTVFSPTSILLMDFSAFKAIFISPEVFYQHGLSRQFPFFRLDWQLVTVWVVGFLWLLLLHLALAWFAGVPLRQMFRWQRCRVGGRAQIQVHGRDFSIAQHWLESKIQKRQYKHPL